VACDKAVAFYTGRRNRLTWLRRGQRMREDGSTSPRARSGTRLRWISVWVCSVGVKYGEEP